MMFKYLYDINPEVMYMYNRNFTIVLLNFICISGCQNKTIRDSTMTSFIFL